MQHRKNRFQIVACFNVVTTKAGQILNHNALDFPCPHILHHTLKLRAVKVCSCKSIVHIGIRQSQPWMFLDITMDLQNLRIQGIFCFMSAVL